MLIWGECQEPVQAHRRHPGNCEAIIRDPGLIKKDKKNLNSWLSDNRYAISGMTGLGGIEVGFFVQVLSKKF